MLSDGFYEFVKNVALITFAFVAIRLLLLRIDNIALQQVKGLESLMAQYGGIGNLIRGNEEICAKLKGIDDTLREWRKELNTDSHDDPQKIHLGINKLLLDASKAVHSIQTIEREISSMGIDIRTISSDLPRRI